ncbi:MAG: sigma-70 family RNA polymerase sigma factor [Wenzhouxiangella sp.]|nr:sigma-70 family RNA polymerase sigma factor [Wenzhouxiangella sp.]
MSPGSEPDLTLLLRRSVSGDEAARDALWGHLHDRLRAMARQRLARESVPQCDPTELVHEAFLKLDRLELAPRDRLHFLALAARAMRQVLVEQARARRRDKRGGGLAPVTLMTRHAPDSSAQAIDVLDLEQALVELERLDPRKARAIELSYFGGLTDEQVADALDVSSATLKRDLRTARAWLATALG